MTINTNISCYKEKIIISKPTCIENVFFCNFLIIVMLCNMYVWESRAQPNIILFLLKGKNQRKITFTQFSNFPRCRRSAKTRLEE